MRRAKHTRLWRRFAQSQHNCAVLWLCHDARAYRDRVVPYGHRRQQDVHILGALAWRSPRQLGGHSQHAPPLLGAAPAALPHPRLSRAKHNVVDLRIVHGQSRGRVLDQKVARACQRRAFATNPARSMARDLLLSPTAIVPKLECKFANAALHMALGVCTFHFAPCARPVPLGGAAGGATPGLRSPSRHGHERAGRRGEDCTRPAHGAVSLQRLSSCCLRQKLAAVYLRTTWTACK